MSIHRSEQWLADYRRRMAGAAGRAKNNAESPATASARPAGKLVPYRPSEAVAVPLRYDSARQTQTEQRYNRECLGGAGRFEAITLRLPGGGRYTPDFLTLDDGVVTLHEVKGSYRLGSQGRAYTAFHEAAAAYPMWRFVWAKWTGRTWERSVVERLTDS